jgi:hypothetical protein
MLAPSPSDILDLTAGNDLHGTEPFLKSHQLLSYSRISRYFIEAEISSSCLQEPATGPYLEPD